MKSAQTLILIALLLSGCTSARLGSSQPPKATCANIDWFEIGRADGRQGALAKKFEEYRTRCEPLGTPPAADVYGNGRELGLLEFCAQLSERLFLCGVFDEQWSDQF